MQTAIESKKRSWIFLTVSMLIIALFIYCKFIFKDRLFIFSINDIGSDTVNMYYPVYKEILRKLRAGEFSLFSLNLGLGDLLLSYQSVIFDPFSLIMYATGLIFGDAAIGYTLVYINILKILCSGYTCYWFLSSFKLSEYSKVTSAIAYAFNGFIILWGQHYFFATGVVLLPLLLGTIERAINNKRYYVAVSAVAFVFSLFSAYLSYMAFVVAAFYFVIRCLQIKHEKITDALVCAIKMIGAMLLGMGMACVLFLPTCYMLITGGERVSVGGSMFSSWMQYPFVYDNNTLITNFLRLISNNLQGSAAIYTGTLNYYESPNLSFTLLFIILLPTYFVDIFKRHKTWLARFATIAGLALTVICIISPKAAFALNMFQTNLQRYTFILMPVFALVLANAVQRAIVEKQANVIMSILVSAALCLVLYHAKKNFGANTKLVAVMMVIAILIAIVICVIKTKSDKKVFVLARRGASWAVIVLICLNIAADSFITVDHRNNVLKNTENSTEFNSANIYYTNLEDAVEYIKEKEGENFYRIEFNFLYGSVNSGLIRGYSSVSAYHSNRAKGYVNYLKTVQNIDNANIFFNMLDTADRDLAGVKYIISTVPEMEGYQKIEQFNDIYVLQRNKEVKAAYIYDSVISNDSLEAMPLEQRKTAVATVAAVENTERTSLPVAQQDSIQSIENGLNELIDHSKNIELIREGTKVNGKVSLENDGMFVLSVPYQDGWKVFVDGEEKNIVQTNLAFIGVELTAGEHNVQFVFETPLLKAGLYISLISMVIFAICLYFTLRKKKQ